MSEFKTIETQEQLDAIVGERIKRERKTIESRYEGYLSPTEVEEKYKGWMSPEEVEEKYKEYLSPEEATKKDARIKNYETDSVKTRIALETGLPYKAVTYLQGEDEASIQKSAESLKSLMGSTGAAPLASTEPTGVNDKDTAIRKMLKDLKGE